MGMWHAREIKNVYTEFCFNNMKEMGPGVA
jgi:hypothetical protein